MPREATSRSELASLSATQKPAGVPDFAIGGVTFRCFVALDQEGTPYVWRATVALGSGGQARYAQLSVGRTGHVHWARVDGRLIGREYGSLKMAMSMAAVALSALRPASGLREGAAPADPNKEQAA